MPLDERAIIALSNNCRALDIYAWLAQRLRRLSRPTLVSWAALQLQFGADHADHYRFRQLFRTTLALALMIQQFVAIQWSTEPQPFPRLLDFGGGGPGDEKFWLPILACLAHPVVFGGR